MNDQNSKPTPPQTADSCNPDEACETKTGGPVREAGGTTGAGNLSPGGASRTGGATSGVDPSETASHKGAALPPSA